MSKHNDKNGQEFIRNISHYKGAERRSDNIRRSHREEGSSKTPDDLTPLIKEYITESLENQKRLIKVKQDKADAETRKTEAIESFLLFVNDFMGNDLSKQATTHRRPYKQRPPDTKHKKVFKVIAKMREKNETYEDIADHLEREGIPTFSGRGTWPAQTVHRLCRDKAYKIFISPET